MKFWLYMFLVVSAFFASLGAMAVLLTRLSSAGIASVSEWIQAALLFGVIGGAIVWTGGIIILAIKSQSGRKG